MNVEWDVRSRLVGHVRQRARRTRALAILLWRASRGLTVAFGLVTAIRGLLPTAIILSTGLLIDAVPGAVEHGLGSPEGTRALGALGAIGLAFLASGVAGAVSRYLEEALTSRFTLAVHDTVARAAARPTGIAALEHPRTAGELSAVEEYDRDGVYRFSIRSLQELVTTRTQAVGAFVILFGFRWWAALVMLAGWRSYDWLFSRYLGESAGIAHQQRSSGLRRARYVRSLAVEAPAAKEVRIFGLGGWIVDQYATTWLSAMRELWQARRAGGRVVIWAIGPPVAAHLVILSALGWAAWRGDVSVAALVVFAQAVLASEAMGPIGYEQWPLSQVLHGAYEVVELDERLSMQPVSGRGQPAPGPASVELRGVRFTYPGQAEPTLAELTLTIPARQSVAIVGVNGAGKTTVIKLLCGLYEPDAGDIRISGTADLVAARERIGVIFQDFVRYQLPLRANVGFGALDHLDDTAALDDALRDAGGSDLLTTLPAGWDSVLARDYENGADLSGGQWQKVALSRALLAVRGGAGLLVLDEPTANLDVRAEAELFDRFLELTRDVTTILVSHRLSTVRHADRIVVLADGRIVEDGPHDELLAAGGAYASMYRLQAERFASEVPDA